LMRRLTKAGIEFKETVSSGGTLFIAETQLGPKFALASWDRVLSFMEHEAISDTSAKSDLIQLRALCDASNNEAFTPINLFETSNQRFPSLVMQLGNVVKEVVDKLVAESAININNLRPQASWDRIGRYARFSYSNGFGIIFWVGIHIELWKNNGTSPLWILFLTDQYGLSQEARAIIEPWAAQHGAQTAMAGTNFAIALEVLSGEEKQAVLQHIADQIKEVAKVLWDLRPVPYLSKPQPDELQIDPIETDS
jgi:hypothetical protein